jgi:hypothetical protein
MLTDVATLTSPPPARVPRPRSRFFATVAGILMLFVLTGFTPTLYLRPAFRPLPIPGYLYVHGAILTGWFALVVVQTFLVQANRVRTHRRLGIAGAVFSIAVVAGGLMATFGVVSRVVAAGISLDADARALVGPGVEGLPIIAFLSNVVWQNLGSALEFAVFVVAGILLRHRPDSHKRLMLLASISIVGPALARLARWPIFGGEGGPFVNVVILALLTLMIVFDLITRKRPHAVTLLGVAFSFVTGGLAGAIANSQFGQQFVRALQ